MSQPDSLSQRVARLARGIGGDTPSTELPPPEAAEKITQPKEKKGLVLLVDDETGILETYGRVLRERGYEVITAESIEQAVDALKKPGKTLPQLGHELDFAILDIRLKEEGRYGDKLYDETLKHGWAFGFGFYSGVPSELQRLTPQLGDLKAAFLLSKSEHDIDYVIAKMEEYLGQTKLQRLRLRETLPAAFRQQIIDFQIGILHSHQRTMLPKQPIHIGDYTIWGVTIPIEHKVGGDIWTVYQWKTRDGIDRLGIIVGDGCGHGIGASTYPAWVLGHGTGHHSLLARLGGNQNPGEYLDAFNSALEGKIPDSSNLAALYGMLDLSGNLFSYTLAGAEPPFFGNPQGVNAVSADENVTGFALGVMPGFNYQHHSLPINKGDRIIIVTDGVGDCTRKGLAQEPKTGDYLRDDGVPALILPHIKKSAEGIVSSVIGQIQQYYNQIDDLTLVVIARD